MIQFEQVSATTTKVTLDNREVGQIRKDADGFRYYPKGRKQGGDPFSTLAACKKSLVDAED